jgi:uncharacterized protein (DUF983 family)
MKKCPGCGGKLRFDAYTQLVKCDQCGQQYEVDYLDHIEKEQDDSNKKIERRDIHL